MDVEGEVTALLEEGFVSTYIAAADGLKLEVLRLVSHETPHFPRLESAFGKPMREISAFRVQPIDKGAFEFDAATGKFVLNLQPLLVLLSCILDDVREAARLGRYSLDRHEIHALFRKAFRLYLLHEVRHLPQGLGDHASVGALKKIAGEGFLADMDLFADRDAAACHAVLEAGDDLTRITYLEHFQQALFIAGQYSFPAFRFTPDRFPKMGRAIGLTFMAARLARVDLERADIASLEKVAPLDACINVKVTGDYSSMAVILRQPETQVVNITLEITDGSLRALANRISDGDFLGAVELASVFLSRMNVVL